jgi:predicted DNA-binding antitoxin AbrB/MazE fold protein
MSLVVDAVYENGVLKLLRPLPLGEHAKVQITVHIAAEPDRAVASYGLLGWTGDSETVQRLALDPEFGISDSA